MGFHGDLNSKHDIQWIAWGKSAGNYGLSCRLLWKCVCRCRCSTHQMFRIWIFPSTDPQTALSPRIIIAEKNQGRPLLLRISDDFCTSLIKAGAKFLAESSNFGSVNIYCQCFSSGIVLVDLVDFPTKSTPVHSFDHGTILHIYIYKCTLLMAPLTPIDPDTILWLFAVTTSWKTQRFLAARIISGNSADSDIW